MRWRRRLRLAAIAVFLIAYAALSHYGNSVVKTRDLAVVLALAPVLMIGLLLVWRGLPRWAALPTAAGTAVLLHHYWPLLEKNFPLVYLLQKSGFYSLMGASFGQSLLAHRVALCTQFADRLHGPLSPQEVLYTRRVTAVWSLFANFCVIPLMGLLFVAEYAVRRRALPQVQRRGILAAVQVYFAGSTRAY